MLSNEDGTRLVLPRETFMESMDALPGSGSPTLSKLRRAPK